MSEELTTIPEIEKKLQTSIETAKQYLAPMKKNADTCVMMLSKFSKPFTTQAEHDEAVSVLAQIKPVMEKIELRRKEITGSFDELKQVMMTPEKAIKASFETAKAYCDAWNQKLADDVKKQKAEIEKKRQADLEAIEIKAALTRKIEMFIANKVVSVDGAMIDFFTKITLANFDACNTAINASPALKQTDYDGFFTGIPTPAHCNDERLQQVIDEVKAGYPFATVSQMYSDEMLKKMQPWRDKMPAKKAELESLSKQSEADQKVAAAKAAEAAAEAAEAAAKAAEAEKAAKEAELEKTANNEKLGAEFTAQIQTQTIAAPTNVRTSKRAKFICEEKDMPVVLTELIFTCITHPKHPGIYDKDKKGNIKTDTDGSPLYADWIESMLKFYATNCKPAITGLQVDDKVSTIAK